MDPTEELQRLRERASALEDNVRDLDDQIERAMHAVADSRDHVGHAMMVLTERRNTQLGMMFELGKVTASIEDLENRIREQDDREREIRDVSEWESERPMAAEDHLDWLRALPDAPPSAPEPNRDERHPQIEGEDRMLAEMHREDRKPEDYLDWWQR